MLDLLYSRILDECSDDMRACILSGCSLETEYQDGVLTIRTRHPVGIVRVEGRTIVYENAIKMEELSS